MAKRNLEIVSKMLSNIPATTPEEPKPEEVVKKDPLEEKKKATKGKKLKGIYLTTENELRLKELQMKYLRKGIRISDSDLVNKAVEEFYLRYKD
jgi:hypothetical protein